jgi:hypothetical protein
VVTVVVKPVRPASRRTTTMLLLGVALLLGCGLQGCGKEREQRDDTPPPATAPRADTEFFEGGRAFGLLREQVKDYGWRPAGSKRLQRLALRLRALMPRGRFESVPQHPGLRNVVGSIPGRLPAILVAAHYDVEARPRGFVGANDGAAGTAAVITLARAFEKAPRPRNARALRFALFDGEEEPAGCKPLLSCGLRGSVAYAARHADKISAVIVLDHIAARRGMRFSRERGSEPGLWSELRRAAYDVGVGSLFPSTQTKKPVISGHTPFAQRGLPAIDVIDADYAQRDSLDDNLDAVAPRSLDAVGEALYRLLMRRRGR